MTDESELTKDNEKLVGMNKYLKFANTPKECVLAIGAFALVVAIILWHLATRYEQKRFVANYAPPVRDRTGSSLRRTRHRG